MLHSRAIQPGFWDGKIVVLVLRRDEAETILPRYGFDCHAPIGAVLGDGDSNGIVRFPNNRLAERRLATGQSECRCHCLHYG